MNPADTHHSAATTRHEQTGIPNWPGGESVHRSVHTALEVMSDRTHQHLRVAVKALVEAQHTAAAVEVMWSHADPGCKNADMYPNPVDVLGAIGLNVREVYDTIHLHEGLRV